MPTVEELLKQRREIEERKLALQKYQLEIAKIQGDINGITCHEEYLKCIGITGYDVDGKKRLKTQLKSKLDQLKMDYQLTPRRIQQQINECEYDLILIMAQLDNIDKQDREHQPEPSHDRER